MRFTILNFFFFDEMRFTIVLVKSMRLRISLITLLSYIALEYYYWNS